MAARNIDLGWTIPAYAADCVLTQGEAITLTFTRDAATTISGWTIVAYLKRYHDDEEVTLTISGSITSAANGIFTVSLTSAQTTAFEYQTYVLQVWRTDSGSETVMSNVLVEILEGQ